MAARPTRPTTWAQASDLIVLVMVMVWCEVFVFGGCWLVEPDRERSTFDDVNATCDLKFRSHIVILVPL